MAGRHARQQADAPRDLVGSVVTHRGAVFRDQFHDAGLAHQLDHLRDRRTGRIAD